jgi:hypothetical protein
MRIAKELDISCSSGCQVQGGKDLADYFRPLPDGWWAVPLTGQGIRTYPKIPRAWWPQIAREYTAGMSGPKLAERWGVNSHRTIYLILRKYQEEQAQA